MNNSQSWTLESATFHRNVEKAPEGDGFSNTIGISFRLNFVSLSGEQMEKLVDILNRTADEVRTLVGW